MHPFAMPQGLIERVERRIGRAHAFEVLDPVRTALVVIDMQNYFMKPGYLGEVPMARQIVPTVNKLAAEVRNLGGAVVWVRNSTDGTRASWSNFHDFICSPENRDRRYATMCETHEGHQLWWELDVRPEDAQVVKKRFSAFLQGSSNIEPCLRSRGIDTVMIAGTATNVCCECTARDAMMLNFKTIMICDATAARSDEEHSTSLIAFYSTFGDVRNADECRVLLLRGAAPR